jgi:hypothetical protein
VKTLDLKRDLRWLYAPSVKEVSELVVPAMDFLMVDGEGDPNTSQGYADAIEALYALAYTLKFSVKRGPLATDYPVMPLEGLWWAEDMSSFTEGDRSAWKWTMMIMQPEIVTAELVEMAATEVARKKNPAALPLVRLERYDEGLSAQLMHIGSYAAEAPNIVRVHEFIAASGHTRRGKHHEIYLSDPRRSAPEKWKTIIRQPME